MSNSTPTEPSSEQIIVKMNPKGLHASKDALFLVRLFARMCQQEKMDGAERNRAAMHAC